MSQRRGLLGLGAGVAAAGVGAALGVAAQRWTSSRGVVPDLQEAYGSLRGEPVRVVASDGAQLYAEVDEPDPELAGDPVVTVVLSHGFGLNMDIWHYQRAFLRGRYRLVFWDLRGHGRSSTGPSDHYTLGQCGADLAAVVATCAPEGPLVIVGHSMGGMTVMEFADQQPDTIRERVVGGAFVATSSGQMASVDWIGLLGLGRVVHKLGPGVLTALSRAPSYVDRTRRMVSSDLETRLVRHYSYASPVPSSLVRFTAAMIASTPIDVLAAFLPGFDLHDKGTALKAFADVPVLVLNGDGDLLTPLEHSEAIAAALPEAEHVLLPRAGHMLMLEHPDVVNLHLAELLDRVHAAMPRPARRRHRGRRRRAR
ncbi:alpha/beta fold hydrolase [Angustibacter aerolatus]